MAREGAPRSAAAGLWLAEAEAILREATGLRVMRDVPLRARTSLGIGGPAPLFVIPRDPEALAAALAETARRVFALTEEVVNFAAGS